jgi:dTDP-4-dehydrorhamnose reductase
MPPIVLIGANGQLGTDLQREFPLSRELIALTHSQLDILQPTRIAAVIDELRPEVIVNTAAFVNVELCEVEVDTAFAVNAHAVRNLAMQADRIGAYLVHISTDYVFDGAGHIPYVEEAPAAPLNVYGRSKLEGESHVRSLCRRHLVVRSSGLYGVAGSSGKGGNFVRTMLRVGREKGEVTVVTDQVLGPTNTVDLAQALWWLVEHEAQGIVHATNAGSCSWFDFARAIFELSGLDVAVHPTDSARLGYRARRPPYSVLDNARLHALGCKPLRLWREALAAHLESIGPLT